MESQTESTTDTPDITGKKAMTALQQHADDNARLSVTLAIATLIHGVILLGIGFTLPDPAKPKTQHSLDVILVHPKPKEQRPHDPDLLANSNQQGGATRKGNDRPRSVPNQPALRRARQAQEEKIRSGHQAPWQQPAPSQVARNKPSHRKVERARKTQVKARTRPDMTQLLASTRQEIARLTAELERNSRYASNKPRRKAISASTREYRYAAYLEAWRRKVERIGNLNYPDAAKRKKLYGDLLLHVAVRADGSVSEIRVLRSSGHKILDDAAVRIVRLAAPFAPFPEEIRKEVDILDITRTWQFLSGNRLFSK